MTAQPNQRPLAPAAAKRPHTPLVLLGDLPPDKIAFIRDWLEQIESDPPRPVARLHPALPAETVTPGLLDIVALRASHFAYGHTIEADLAGRRPGMLARRAEEYMRDALDLLARGPAERPRARVKLARAAALALAELDRLDAQDRAEPLRL